MKINKTSKIAIRLEPKEKRLLGYFATRLGLSPSSLVRNQIKVLLKDLEGNLQDKHYSNIAKVSLLSGPEYTQEEIENLFEVNK